MILPFTPPAFADIEDAARQIQGVARRTPILENDALNAHLGARVLLKLETLQRTGSFKFRGAYNLISRLSPEALQRGVVAFSSGNHAQGVAAAAKILGAPATIVMPSDAPALKIAGVKAYGGEVVLYDRWTESREAIAAALQAQTGATLAPPFEHPHIIAGQGTAGLELIEQVRDLRLNLDAVLAPASGGGLVGGVGLAVKHFRPSTDMYVVEPEVFNDHALSLAAGAPVALKPGAPSICDALQSPKPGDLTFALNKVQLTAALSVSDDEVRAALRYAFETLKLVIEPGGAVGLAALLSGKLEVRGKTVAVVLSGGNVDPGLFAEILRG